MFGLQGKVVVITGPKGGLGTYVTQAFLEAGANVVGISRSIANSDFDNHHRFTALPSPLGDSASARAAIDQVVERFERLDALVHLLGGFTGGNPIAETDDEVLKRMLNLNLESAFYAARAVVPHMRRQGGGRILAVGSRTAAEPQANVAAYGASKAALVFLMRSLALETKSNGIAVNVVLPGTMDTPANRAANPQADPAQWVAPAQVANLLMYLASDAAQQITGAAIPVYGRDL